VDEKLTHLALDAIHNAGLAFGAYRNHYDGCDQCQRGAVRGRWCHAGKRLWLKVEAADRVAEPVWQKATPRPVFLPLTLPPGKRLLKGKKSAPPSRRKPRR